MLKSVWVEMFYISENGKSIPGKVFPADKKAAMEQEFLKVCAPRQSVSNSPQWEGKLTKYASPGSMDLLPVKLQEISRKYGVRVSDDYRQQVCTRVFPQQPELQYATSFIHVFGLSGYPCAPKKIVSLCKKYWSKIYAEPAYEAWKSIDWMVHERELIKSEQHVSYAV